MASAKDFASTLLAQVRQQQATPASPQQQPQGVQVPDLFSFPTPPVDTQAPVQPTPAAPAAAPDVSVAGPTPEVLQQAQTLLGALSPGTNLLNLGSALGLSPIDPLMGRLPNNFETRALLQQGNLAQVRRVAEDLQSRLLATLNPTLSAMPEIQALLGGISGQADLLSNGFAPTLQGQSFGQLGVGSAAAQAARQILQNLIGGG